MSYGLELKTSDGKILIDGEHVMPKLYFESEITVNTHVSTGWGSRWTKSVSFTPTSKPVIVTVDITNSNSFLYPVQIIKNASNQYAGVFLEGAYAEDASITSPKVRIRVYEL